MNSLRLFKIKVDLATTLFLFSNFTFHSPTPVFFAKTLIAFSKVLRFCLKEIEFLGLSLLSIVHDYL